MATPAPALSSCLFEPVVAEAGLIDFQAAVALSATL